MFLWQRVLIYNDLTTRSSIVIINYDYYSGVQSISCCAWKFLIQEITLYFQHRTYEHNKVDI